MFSVTLIMRFPAAQRMVGRDLLVGVFCASGISPSLSESWLRPGRVFLAQSISLEVTVASALALRLFYVCFSVLLLFIILHFILKMYPPIFLNMLMMIVWENEGN